MGDIRGFDQLSNLQHGINPIDLSVPLMSREKFAELVGLPLGVLIGQCEKGYWPQLHIGKRVFINVALVQKQCLEREFSL